jgi:hypothetical protein
MTEAEMLARIAALEAQLSSNRWTKPKGRSTVDRPSKAAKAAERARRRQFKLDAWRRANRHRSLNRYAIQH